MWGTPPEDLILAPGIVHLWRAALQVPPAALTQYSRLLSAEEQQKADRFYFAKDRDKYIAGRGILRCLLGQYTGVAAESITFSYTEFGKPLAGQFPQLKFNLSHSADMALYGFTTEAEIGVDLESVRKDLEFTQVAKHFFAKNERNTLAALPVERQPDAFFRCWTSKEAFIKAHGQGLSLPLDQFEVEVLPHNAAAIKAVHWDPQLAVLWDIRAFSVQENYTGALVLDRQIAQVNFYNWIS